MPADPRSDEELILATPADAGAFRAFYERYEGVILGYFRRRVATPEEAVDLTAETFVAVLQASRRFKPGPPAPSAWLFGIANNVWLNQRAADKRSAHARWRLGMERPELSDQSIEAVNNTLSDDEVLLEIGHLPEDQREAIRRRVLEEADYSEIADEMALSEAAVRQRVSRGLRTLAKRWIR